MSSTSDLLLFQMVFICIGGALLPLLPVMGRTWWRRVKARLREYLNLADLESKQQERLHLARVSTIGKLSASISHELNQPLAAILSNAQTAKRLLERKSKSFELQEIQEILDDIIADDLRASEVIRSLRAMLQNGEIRRRPFHINKVLQETLVLAQYDLRMRSISLSTNLGHSLPAVCGDRIQLQQVILNLIINGADAMADTPLQDRILLIGSQLVDEGTVGVFVDDRGCGIEADDLERIFDPLFTTKSHGMGMGLSISRSIITAHGGRLWATNNSPQGTTLRFTMPAMRAVQ